MKLPGIRRVPRCGAWVSVCVLAALPARASDWTPTHGELGYGGGRFALNIGVNYGSLSGSEVQRVDPGPGIEAGVGVHVLWGLSVVGSVAWNQSDVKGQVTQLLDQIVRPDGRSGTVDGTFTATRLRAGIRFDALREQGWRFHPYLVAAVVRANNEVELKTVNGEPPEMVPGPPPDFEPIDISRFDKSQWGGMGRFGVEWSFSPRLSFDLNGTYEVLEFPSGTNALTTVNGGVVLRL